MPSDRRGGLPLVPRQATFALLSPAHEPTLYAGSKILKPFGADTA
jgi:hypothetical protein